MGGLSWAELLVVGIVALIVIGPKDLPEMFRQLGRFTAKARSMAGEFSRAMEQAARESGAADAAADLKSMTSAKSMGMDKVRAAMDGFEKWDPVARDRPKTQPLTPPPMPPTTPAAAPQDDAAHDPAPAKPQVTS
jgi:sec-independent protein translocase protein TatB